MNGVCGGGGLQARVSLWVFARLNTASPRATSARPLPPGRLAINSMRGREGARTRTRARVGCAWRSASPFALSQLEARIEGREGGGQMSVLREWGA